jgi:hypothetical protein
MLSAEDTRPSKMLPAAKVEWYWRTPDARYLYELLGKLRGTERQALSEAARRTRGWRLEAEAFLASVERWTPHDMVDLDEFYQRGMLLARFFALAPQADLRARAARDVVELLRRSTVNHDHPALWWLPAARLLESVRGQPRPELLDLFEQSGVPVLGLYAHAERIVPVAGRRAK